MGLNEEGGSPWRGKEGPQVSKEPFANCERSADTMSSLPATHPQIYEAQPFPNSAEMPPEPVTEPATASSLFVPGRNCWRIERSPRAAFLVDADAYFKAF